MSKDTVAAGRTKRVPNCMLGISGSAAMSVEVVATIISEGGLVSASRIAEVIGVKRTVVLKCMEHIRGSGLLDSVYNRNGGYRVAVDPDSLSVLDVIRAVDGEKHGSIFSDDIAFGIKSLLRKQLENIPIKRIVLELETRQKGQIHD